MLISRFVLLCGYLNEEGIYMIVYIMIHHFTVKLFITSISFTDTKCSAAAWFRPRYTLRMTVNTSVQEKLPNWQISFLLQYHQLIPNSIFSASTYGYIYVPAQQGNVTQQNCLTPLLSNSNCCQAVFISPVMLCY